MIFYHVSSGLLASDRWYREFPFFVLLPTSEMLIQTVAIDRRRRGAISTAVACDAFSAALHAEQPQTLISALYAHPSLAGNL